jgi:hypothetical protein
VHCVAVNTPTSKTDDIGANSSVARLNSHDALIASSSEDQLIKIFNLSQILSSNDSSIGVSFTLLI